MAAVAHRSGPADPGAELDVARELRLLVERLAVGIGLDAGAACDLAAGVERDFRSRNGGCRVNVPVRDRRRIRAEVRRDFNGRNRDELCERYGISRATFYRILGERRA